MSHPHHRKENNCLNCGTEVIGKFCHNCGQANLEPKETIWQLINHFFADITHFDGKIFSSLRLVIFKPGFLSKEYIIGRRMRYLHPIRMYLFVSAIFFLIFFSVVKFDETDITTDTVTSSQIDKMDSVKFEKFAKAMNNGKLLSRDSVKKRMALNEFHLTPRKYNSRKEYDSLVSNGIKKHNWFETLLVHKDLELNEKYHHDGKEILIALVNKLLHTIPQMLFVLMPLFALVLKLLYIRRKNFYYVDHAIFTLHFYIFIFIDMLLVFGLDQIRLWLHWKWLKYFEFILILAIFYYLYKALRNFYKQRRAKTIFKFLILLLMFLIIFMFLFIAFFFLSMFGI